MQRHTDKTKLLPMSFDDTLRSYETENDLDVLGYTNIQQLGVLKI